MTIKLRRYAALDGLRGIAALLVALLHTPFQSPMCDIALIRNGGLYVDFFFVLSGFVLTHAHVNKNDTFTSFFIKRTGRLWPLHIFLLAALIGLECFKLLMDRHGIPSDQAAFTEAHSWTSILSNIFLVQALGMEWSELEHQHGDVGVNVIYRFHFDRSQEAWTRCPYCRGSERLTTFAGVS
jgi:peptidoglycan/LPS O-acetylase OafA/YrhL